MQENAGAWRLFVTLELPKAPSMPHVPMKFLFTKQAVYERSLTDNSKDPVTNRMSLTGQTASVESLDVDFADGSGHVFKGTHFDFMLTRARGYEAGEYKLQVRTSDGADVGGSASLTLKGENPVVDRRSITFNAKEKSIKKVASGVENAPRAADNNEDAPASPGQQDVQAVGTPPPFVSPDAYNPTDEERVKEKPKGCGCSVPGHDAPVHSPLAGLLGGAIAAALVGRRSRAKSR